MTELVPSDDLATRAAALEQQLVELRASSRASLVRAELRTEAVRAGMVDLDGLKLIDTATLAFNGDGELADAGGVMRTLMRNKPWLFGSASTSSSATPPTSAPPRQKRATEMTDDEYRVARAAVLRRR